jgi:hypothetical protein
MLLEKAKSSIPFVNSKTGRQTASGWKRMVIGVDDTFPFSPTPLMNVYQHHSVTRLFSSTARWAVPGMP